MINQYKLTKDQVFQAMQNGEFSSEVISSQKKTVIIMTQDWCPQWAAMSKWIYSLETGEELNIYELIYNKVDYSQEFMNFKENTFGNHEIPYLRYYNNGKLVNETNYVNMQQFKSILGI